MTETTHTRSRRAALGGLLVQLVAFVGVLALALASRSQATLHAAWYILGGVPIWFAALLVFRQCELADLEAMDLENLRREKAATGGGEALFGAEGSAALGFRVAEVRLRWMRRWLIPAFGLFVALYLGAMAVLLWQRLGALGLELGGEAGWPLLAQVPVTMVVLAILFFGLVLYSRYTSGMGRVPEWQLLRGCGSYMLGNALVLVVLLIALGVYEYSGGALAWWEHVLAYAIVVLMGILAIETLANFVLDIYRPRAADAEPRAAFDSRLLGLVAEPGGIAHSIAEAINYQFGFQVSQTWFYRLLERTAVPLLFSGAMILWLLTSVVVVQPYEHAIIERFGRQLNAEDPLEPGIHLKLPWPIDVAKSYNTGRLHQIFVGFERYDAQPELAGSEERVMLWTDTEHFDLAHFEILIAPPPESAQEEAGEAAAPGPEASVIEAELARGTVDDEQAQPVHLIRMIAAVQYRIQAERLDRYTRAMHNPERMLLDVSWEEVGRYIASLTVEQLLGRELHKIGEDFREMISARVEPYGIEVVYVGVTNVHPERSVAEAYRNVVQAEQERLSAIREARVTESQRLSEVAGDARRARVLAEMIARATQAERQFNVTSERLARVGDPEAVAALAAALAEHRDRFAAALVAEVELEHARERLARVEHDFELGLGRQYQEQVRAQEAAGRAEEAAAEAHAALEAALAPLRARAEAALGGSDAVDALFANARARVAREEWAQRLRAQFTPETLQGEAAAILAEATAQRWETEMRAARNLIQVEREGEAFDRAPDVYRARTLAQTLSEGLAKARKFFLAFTPGDRTVRVRFIATEESRTDVWDLRAGTETRD